MLRYFANNRTTTRFDNFKRRKPKLKKILIDKNTFFFSVDGRFFCRSRISDLSTYFNDVFYEK